MSSSGSSSPSTIPFKFRRKSSSASTSVSLDDHMYSREDTAFSSPLPSSSPPLTPLHGTRGYDCKQWEHPKYMDDMGCISYDQEHDCGDAKPLWSCYTRDDETSLAPHPLPSLMSKFAVQAVKNQASTSFQSPLYAACRTTSYFYPYGDSALADDDGEEYDLESMDIHIRETYFATSSERGRWLSSPIATRVRTQTISPRHGQSSPVKTTVDASPSAGRVRRHIISRLADKERSVSSSSDDHDEDVRFSSPLPPSSPLTSPISNLSSLPDCKDGKTADSCHLLSNSNNCTSLGASDLSSSPITCTSPLGSTCPLSQFEAPDKVPGLDRSNSTHFSRILGNFPGHGTMYIDIEEVEPTSPDAINSKLDAMPSRLSPFDDLPEVAESETMPLSNTKNTPHSGRPASTPETVMNIALETAASSIDRPSAQPLSVDVKHETPDIIAGPSANGIMMKRKKSPSSRSDVPRKKRAVVQLGTGVSDMVEEEEERRGVAKGKERHGSDDLERPKKKSKSSDGSSHSDDRRPKHSRRRKHALGSPSHSTVGVDRDHSSPPSTLLDPVDPAESEFHASLTGMLIEALATSRATSMDSAALYLAVTQTHPNLATERPKQKFQMLITTVLESGRARCGMFEKVDSSGEASRHKALESRWFYVPDRDEDRERASLISAIMPRQKRSETKKYKQYYYRPLEKMSRWDPEDAP